MLIATRQQDITEQKRGRRESQLILSAFCVAVLDINFYINESEDTIAYQLKLD